MAKSRINTTARSASGKSAVQQAKERDAARKAGEAAAKTTSGGGGSMSASLTMNGSRSSAGFGSSSSGSASRPVSSGGVSPVSASADYHQQAKDAAARGDWSAVNAALAARQAKIDAQGGNDRGTSNGQILSALQSQYGGPQASGLRDGLTLNTGGRLTYDAAGGEQGSLGRDKGWQDGTDYLAMAKQAASGGDMDTAYDALMRRGFKMADTGSAGGGTSQDQAYAMIQQLYNQSPAARREYQTKVETNSQRLAEHQTQFGMNTVPALANKQIKSQDGKYWILYDGAGKPSVAMPASQRSGGIGDKVGYSDEEKALMAQYYGGSEDYSELQRRLHNLAVVRTGVGRLVDAEGNFASGQEAQPIALSDWTGVRPGNAGQDRQALQAILDQINAGQTFAGGPVSVPSAPAGETGGRTYGGAGGYPSGGSIGRSSVQYGGGGYDSDDLTDYIRQMYQENLNAQLAALESAYQQNVMQSKAHDDLVAQQYMGQRNQAAAQSDLQRMYMTEQGALQGLNTGASGQIALALSSGLRDNLASLGAAEAQDLAASDLARRQLFAALQGDTASAMAQSNSALASAIYNELVRQEEAAQEAARWQAQWEYQQQQDALSQSNWERQFLYGQQQDAASLAMTLLNNGILPDSATLSAAGIPMETAQAALVRYSAPKASTSRQSSTGGSGDGKPKLTYAQTVAAIENGQINDSVKAALDYYMGEGAYEQFYGGSTPDSGMSGGNVDVNSLDTSQIANTHYGDFVRMTRPDGKTEAASWDMVSEKAAKGEIAAKANGDGTYTLYYTK